VRKITHSNGEHWEAAEDLEGKKKPYIREHINDLERAPDVKVPAPLAERGFVGMLPSWEQRVYAVQWNRNPSFLAVRWKGQSVAQIMEGDWLVAQLADLRADNKKVSEVYPVGRAYFDRQAGYSEWVHEPHADYCSETGVPWAPRHPPDEEEQEEEVWFEGEEEEQGEADDDAVDEAAALQPQALDTPMSDKAPEVQPDKRPADAEPEPIPIIKRQRLGAAADEATPGEDWPERLKMVLCRPENKDAIVTDQSGRQYLRVEGHPDELNDVPPREAFPMFVIRKAANAEEMKIAKITLRRSPDSSNDVKADSKMEGPQAVIKKSSFADSLEEPAPEVDGGNGHAEDGEEPAASSSSLGASAKEPASKVD